MMSLLVVTKVVGALETAIAPALRKAKTQNGRPRRDRRRKRVRGRRREGDQGWRRPCARCCSSHFRNFCDSLLPFSRNIMIS